MTVGLLPIILGFHLHKFQIIFTATFWQWCRGYGCQQLNFSFVTKIAFIFNPNIVKIILKQLGPALACPKFLA